MEFAIAEARRGLGTTAPNPSVGAAVVRDGRVLGVGHTAPVGGPHAEVRAFAAARAAGHDLAGSTLYVTLEPCRHHGRTPPCTDAIRAAGVARVVVGVVDPFPPMRGRSIAELRDAGVDVELGVQGDACAELVRGFARVVVHGLPEVTLKLATSLDGHIATSTGESRWITGPAARREGHHLRATHDAIVVGSSTVKADDPALTTRDVNGPDAVPVVFDTSLSTPADAKLLRGPRRAVLIAADDAPERDVAADVIRVPRGPGGLDVESALRALAARGLHRILVEGGGALIRSFLDARLADTLVAFTAGTVLPGGRPSIGGAPVASLGDAPRFRLVEARAVDGDLMHTWRLPHRLDGGT
jgi:diaminohydroxyphosphoribosylaminopyrimidine deaminase/5-amino-6-(5-phosphoribosylamino)uracil reductase